MAQVSFRGRAWAHKDGGAGTANDAPGAQVSLGPQQDAKTIVYYAGATASPGSDGGVTGTNGIALLANVPVPSIGSDFQSLVDVTATPVGLGRPIGTVTVPIHAGILTTVVSQPTP